MTQKTWEILTGAVIRKIRKDEDKVTKREEAMAKAKQVESGRVVSIIIFVSSIGARKEVGPAEGRIFEDYGLISGEDLQ